MRIIWIPSERNRSELQLRDLVGLSIRGLAVMSPSCAADALHIAGMVGAVASRPASHRKSDRAVTPESGGAFAFSVCAAGTLSSMV